MISDRNLQKTKVVLPHMAHVRKPNIYGLDLKFVELVQANFICRLLKGCWGGVVEGLRLII